MGTAVLGIYVATELPEGKGGLVETLGIFKDLVELLGLGSGTVGWDKELF